LSFEIDSNEVMDEHFPALCTPQPLLPLLNRMPQETLLDPGIYGWCPCPSTWATQNKCCLDVNRALLTLLLPRSHCQYHLSSQALPTL
jgi:hypothetical protein